MFTASDIETWSIERVVEENGVRTPSWLDSQKNFRVATMLIVDDPARSWDIAPELSEALRAFSVPGPAGDPGSYNFWEATGGRATLTTDGLESDSVPRVPRPFTDHPIVPAETPVRAVHFTELRARIDILRVGTSLGRFAWTDPILRAGLSRVRLVHLLELRAALTEAYSAAGRAAPVWTDAVADGGHDPDPGGARDGASRRGAGAGVGASISGPAAAIPPQNLGGSLYPITRGSGTSTRHGGGSRSAPLRRPHPSGRPRSSPAVSEAAAPAGRRGLTLRFGSDKGD